MINFDFEVYKLSREIKRSGTEVEFLRPGKNNYGEKDFANLVSLSHSKGLYHEQNSYIELRTGDTTQYRPTKKPMMLFLAKDISPLRLEVEDVCRLNGKDFRVVKIQDIYEKGLIFDISLEVLDIGV